MNSKIVIAGGSGFLGQALAAAFKEKGFEIVVLTRHPDQLGTGRAVAWDGLTLAEWRKELEGALALINLAGKSVDCRYHARNRRDIMESRIAPTQVLGVAIGKCAHPPKVWLNSSTATLYRHTFGPAWDESGEIAAAPEAKDAFSIEVATSWERTFQAAQTPRTRKVALRTAMVLGRGKNSVFPVLHRLTRFGLGGRMGSGRQFVSWIHETDYYRAVEWLLQNETVMGPVNIAAPNPLPNAEMMRILRGILGVPFGLPSPAAMLELGAVLLRTETELVLKSRRVIPALLMKHGFEFRFPRIEQAFEDLCRKP